MIEAMVRGYQESLVCCCWRRAILHERSSYRDPFAVAVIRSGVIIGHVPSLAVSQLDTLK